MKDYVIYLQALIFGLACLSLGERIGAGRWKTSTALTAVVVALAGFCLVMRIQMMRFLALAAVLLAASTAHCETLLTTVSATVFGRSAPDSLSLTWQTTPPSLNKMFQIQSTESVIGTPQNVPIDPFHPINTRLVDGESTEIFTIESNTGFFDFTVFQDGSSPYDVDSEITPLQIDLLGLNLHLSRMAFTTTAIDRQNFSTSFTFQLFGEVGEIPEPSSLAIITTLGLPILCQRRTARTCRSRLYRRG